MKILLQNFNTGLYLAETGSWTTTVESAKAFLNLVRATEYKLRFRLAHVFAVVRPEALQEAPSTTQERSLASRSPVSSMKSTRRAPKTARIIPLPETGLKRINGKSRIPADLSTIQESPAASSSKPASSRVAAAAVLAKIDVGLGNTLFIRGQGGGLSWDKGIPLTCAGTSIWSWRSDQVVEKLIFKLLLNDTLWARGDNLEAAPGGNGGSGAQVLAG